MSKSNWASIADELDGSGEIARLQGRVAELEAAISEHRRQVEAYVLEIEPVVGPLDVALWAVIGAPGSSEGIQKP